MTGKATSGGLLTREMETYAKLLDALASDEGKFALIIGSDLVDVYVAQEDALKEGYKRAGLKPFLVKKISGSESVMFFTRDAAKVCHTMPAQ